MRDLPKELIESLEKLYEEVGDPYLESDEKSIDQKVGFNIDDEAHEIPLNLQDAIHSLNWDDFKIDIESNVEEWQREIHECQEHEEQLPPVVNDKIETEEIS